MKEDEMARICFNEDDTSEEKSEVGAFLVRMGFGSIYDPERCDDTIIVIRASWAAKEGFVIEEALDEDLVQRIAEMPGVLSVNPEALEDVLPVRRMTR